MAFSILAKLALATTVFSSLATGASYNGLAVTPQLGWDNWNAFGCDVSEELLLGTAEKIVSYGLRDLGYSYIVLDDCWSDGRSPEGKLQPNMTKFPNGMKYVADRIHAMGLRFGMYSSAGIYTCALYAGSLGREKEDAQTFAEWGVDYLKYDNCFNAGQSGTSLITYNRYVAMSKALIETGRPILYSMCNWGEDYPWNWAQTMANSWRMSGDVYDSFNRPDERCPCATYDCTLPGFQCSIMNIVNKMAAIPSKSQPGAWNDMDGLEIGNGGMTDDEYKVHFSMWAILKSPLLMSTDIRRMTGSTLSIFSNPAILAISQDPLGSAAHRVWKFPAALDNHSQGEINLWVGGLSGGDFVVALVNAGNKTLTMNASLADIFLDQSTSGTAPEIMHTWDVHDLWTNRMDNATTTAILSGKLIAVDMYNSTLRYNSTELSYAEGLAVNHPALLGTKTTSIPPRGTLKARVPRHGIGLFRIRSRGDADEGKFEL